MSTHEDLLNKALTQLREQIVEAGSRGNPDPGSAALATARASGAPSVRMIDVLRLDETGATLFTDAASGKARQLRENAAAALCWYWPETRFQAILEGRAEILPDEEADRCWRTRPREKRLGSWASEQSRPLEDDRQLERRLREAREQFRTEPVPRPEGWCAFRILPQRIELWQTGWKRLRAKRVYEKSADSTWSETVAGP